MIGLLRDLRSYREHKRRVRLAEASFTDALDRGESIEVAVRTAIAQVGTAPARRR